MISQSGKRLSKQLASKGGDPMKRIVIVAIICLIVGFGAGYEYAAYRIQSAFQQAFKPLTQGINQQNPTPTPNLPLVQYKVGDIVKGHSFDFVVQSASLTKTISSSYGSPQTSAGEFLVLQVQATSNLGQNFLFYPDDYFTLGDNKQRSYKTYSNTIGSIDNYMNDRQLTPGIPQSGVLVYEVPADATSFMLISRSAKSIDVINIQPSMGNQ